MFSLRRAFFIYCSHFIECSQCVDFFVLSEKDFDKHQFIHVKTKAL